MAGTFTTIYWRKGSLPVPRNYATYCARPAGASSCWGKCDGALARLAEYLHQNAAVVRTRPRRHRTIRRRATARRSQHIRFSLVVVIGLAYYSSGASWLISALNFPSYLPPASSTCHVRLVV